MEKYEIKEKIILVIGLIAIAVSIYLQDYFILPLVLIAYIVFLIWNKFIDKQKS